MTLFDRVYEILRRQVPKPDLVIHLHAPVDVLLDRIRSRGRDYEQDMDPEYLLSLHGQYNEMFARHEGKILSVDTTNVDFREPGVVDRLLETIRDGQTGPIEPAIFALKGQSS